VLHIVFNCTPAFVIYVCLDDTFVDVIAACLYVQAAIRRELNDFKSAEMEVHKESRHMTRFVLFLFLHQTRLADRGVMFSSCSVLHTCVHVSIHLSVTKLVTTIF